MKMNRKFRKLLNAQFQGMKDLFRVRREDWAKILVKERMNTRLIYAGP